MKVFAFGWSDRALMYTYNITFHFQKLEGVPVNHHEASRPSSTILEVSRGWCTRGGDSMMGNLWGPSKGISKGTTSKIVAEGGEIDKSHVGYKMPRWARKREPLSAI